MCDHHTPLPCCLVGLLGFEPRTKWLKATCSTTELQTRCLVGKVGFEPTTSAVSERHSNQLSYLPVLKYLIQPPIRIVWIIVKFLLETRWHWIAVWYFFIPHLYVNVHPLLSQVVAIRNVWKSLAECLVQEHFHHAFIAIIAYVFPLFREVAIHFTHAFEVLTYPLGPFAFSDDIASSYEFGGPSRIRTYSAEAPVLQTGGDTNFPIRPMLFGGAAGNRTQTIRGLQSRAFAILPQRRCLVP